MSITKLILTLLTRLPRSLSELFKTYVYLEIKENNESKDYKLLRFVLKTLTMNIWNIGSKESLGNKFNDGICAKFHLKLWCKSDW